jgi:uncharacterized Zn-binding protein involved in type VI secretion
MARSWIVVGDATTGGGRVISGSPFTDVDGKAVARVTDKATCAAHKGVFSILDGDHTIIIDGHPVALHGSTLACGCKVLAVQQRRAFVDSGGAANESAPSREANEAAAAAMSLPCDEQLQFVGATGAALAGLRYSLHLDDGRTISGVLDAAGRTQRVATSTSVVIAHATLGPPQATTECCTASLLPAQKVEIQTTGAKTHVVGVGTSVHQVRVPAEDRGLTPGEVGMLSQVFGSSIDYRRVRLHNHGYWLLFGFQPDDTATAPNGEIYLPADLFETDFSLQPNRKQRLLVHEMTHVWQYQLGYPVKSVRGPRPYMSYGYSLGGGKLLHDFNMEAQGNILADYFLLKFRQSPQDLYETKYRLTTNALLLFENTLSQFIANPASRSNLPLVT